MLAQLVNAMLGCWLMAAPAILGYAGPAGLNDRIVGPPAAAFALIAMHQVTRAFRWVNVPLGLWLLASPWLMQYGIPAALNSLIVGLLLTLLAPLGETPRHAMGGGWSVLRDPGRAATPSLSPRSLRPLR